MFKYKKALHCTFRALCSSAYNGKCIPKEIKSSAKSINDGVRCCDDAIIKSMYPEDKKICSNVVALQCIFYTVLQYIYTYKRCIESVLCVVNRNDCAAICRQVNFVFSTIFKFNTMSMTCCISCSA